MKLFVWLLIFIVLVVHARGEQKTAQPKTPAAAKLTAAQLHGFRLLRSAEASAGGLEPATHAFVLWQVAEAYEKLQPRRYVALLVRAFQATYDIPSPTCTDSPDTCHEKSQLQSHILEEILFAAPKQAEDLLPFAEPDTRRQETGLLVREYIHENNLSHAQDLLTAQVGEKDFPYAAAADLIQAIPDERGGDRALVFAIACKAFRDSEPEAGPTFVDDLGIIVIRFWRQLPVDAALEAIDLILDRAKSAAGTSADMHVTFRSPKKSLSLGLYEYRLFELLPVLRELDPPRAESLLRDNQEASSALKTYSQGLNSFMPALVDPSAKLSDDSEFPQISIQTASSSNKPDAPDPALLAQSIQITDQMNAATFQASNDPEAAFRIAMTLPTFWRFVFNSEGSSPRGYTLGRIAKACVKRNPAVARKALEEANKIVDIPLESAAQLVIVGAEVYQALHETEAAEQSILQGIKFAEKLYDADMDPADPNLAMKPEWISTGYWGHLIRLAAKISPRLPEQIIGQIRDPEIQAVEKVAFGNALAGTEAQPLTFKGIHKKRRTGMAFF